MKAYERIDDSIKFDGKTRDSHELRYRIASQFINSKDIILDAGCGTGYGGEIIREALGYNFNCISLDKNPPNSAFGKNVCIKHDFEKNYFPIEELDVFIGFEIVEHLNDKGVKNFIETAKQADKYIIVSTPIIPNSNPYHKQQFSREQMIVMFMDDDWELHQYLEQNKIYGIFIFKRKTDEKN